MMPIPIPIPIPMPLGTLRVGVLSYPMLFQRQGGLQIQIGETIAALNRLPAACRGQLHVELAQGRPLDDYHVLHVFSTINGNQRIVETAHDLGVPVLLSPLLAPDWSRAAGWRARLAGRLAGRLTGWKVQTSYAQTARALHLARQLVALGDAERDAMVDAFRVPAGKIRVLPNGVAGGFFSADGAAFRRHLGNHRPFVLMTGAISPYKNQLGLARALRATGLELVLIGTAQRADQAYLQQLVAMPGVRWLGQLAHDDPLLASACAAAAVLALPSQGEVMPLSVLEALAAGTPVVMTRRSALHLPGSDFALKRLRWDDEAELARAITALVAAPPPRDAVRALVAGFSWERVAAELATLYAALANTAKFDDRGACDAV